MGKKWLRKWSEGEAKWKAENAGGQGEDWVEEGRVSQDSAGFSSLPPPLHQSSFACCLPTPQPHSRRDLYRSLHTPPWATKLHNFPSQPFHFVFNCLGSPRGKVIVKMLEKEVDSILLEHLPELAPEIQVCCLTHEIVTIFAGFERIGSNLSCRSNDTKLRPDREGRKRRFVTEVARPEIVNHRPVAGKSPWGGPSPPNSPKSPLFVRVPPYLHTKIFPMGGAMAPLAPPSATGLVNQLNDGI